MTQTDDPILMTRKALLALPDDGVERWLIDGELREDESGATVRPFTHGVLTAVIGSKLLSWLDSRPDLRGFVGSCVGYELQEQPVTFVGVDVAYTTHERAKIQTEEEMIKGAPILAVEIVSPTDRVDRMEEKVAAYLAAGTDIVWVVSPRMKTVTIYTTESVPTICGSDGTLDAEPHLPGFRLPLAELFVD